MLGESFENYTMATGRRTMFEIPLGTE
jgi:hypothetical protein